MTLSSTSYTTTPQEVVYPENLHATIMKAVKKQRRWRLYKSMLAFLVYHFSIGFTIAALITWSSLLIITIYALSIKPIIPNPGSLVSLTLHLGIASILLITINTIVRRRLVVIL